LSRTFDARQLVLELEGSGDPIAEWPLAALLCVLRERLLAPPWLAADPAQRLAVLTEVVSALESRGLDASSIVRFGLLDRFVRAFMTGIVVGNIVASLKHKAGEPGSSDDVSADQNAFLRQWAVFGQQQSRSLAAGAASGRAFSISIDEDEALFLLRTDSDVEGKDRKLDPEIGEVVKGLIDETLRQLITPAAIGHLLDWIGSAPLRSLLAWENVEVSTGPTMLHTANHDLFSVYRWLIDRLTVTYLACWHTESLHLEWRWIHGEMTAPFEIEILKERTIALPDLNAEIAHRAVRGRESNRDLTLDQAKDQAIDLLKSGDRRSAAELFRAVCHRWPNSSEAHNNLGFCILPDDPVEAVLHLCRGRDLGYDALATSAVNLMQAYLLNGENRLALDAAQGVWENWETSLPTGGAWHWAWEDRPRLILVRDPRLPVLLLAADAAVRMGLPVAEEWCARHEEHCSDAASECLCHQLLPRRGGDVFETA
jgi:hypothetical protein